MISKQYFEITFSLDTARALQEWANINLITNTDAPPIYEMTESLVNDGSFDYLFNSAFSGEQFNAKLLTSGDIAWNPTVQEYPQDATIDFGTNYADTQWTPPADAEYTFTFVEDVANNSYSMVSINPKGDGSTADVLYDGVLTAENTGLNYTPPTESVKLTENMSQTLVPKLPTCAITMSQYTFGAGGTATVTFTWDVVVEQFYLNNITAPNGTMSNLSQNTDSPWIWTATFTPDADVNDDTNTLTILGGAYLIIDSWGNDMTETATSPNYRVNTASGFEVYINYDDINTITPGFTVNTITSTVLADAPSDYLDSTGNTTGISTTNIDMGSVSTNAGSVGNGGCFSTDDDFVIRNFGNGTGVKRGFDIVLPTGTYDFKFLSSRSSTGDRTTLFEIGAKSVTVDGASDGGPWCGDITDVAGGTTITFTYYNNTGGFSYLNAMKITKTA